MKASGYYSSLPNNNEASNAGKVATPPSPRQAIESASTTISQAVSSARKMKDRARSFVPKKLLAVQCTPVKRVGGSTDLDILDEECTPVIYYTDEEAVAKRAADKSTTFVDPFSFEGSESPGDSNSPTSVVPVRLFSEEEGISNRWNDSEKKNIPSTPAKDNDKQKSVAFGDAVTFDGDSFPPVSPKDNDKKKSVSFDDVVSFDCPIFTQDKRLINDDDSSIEFSETIKSINAMSIKEETKSIRESLRALKESREKQQVKEEDWQDSWNGFARAPNFGTHKLDADDTKNDDDESE